MTPSGSILDQWSVFDSPPPPRQAAIASRDAEGLAVLILLGTFLDGFAILVVLVLRPIPEAYGVDLFGSGRSW
jgi:hypothetical protein